MGCTTSKLDDDEAVQLCKDRRNFIKQAVEQRTRFASGHIAYIQSLKRVSAALRDYVDGDEPREFSLDSFVTPSFTPVKKSSPGFISFSPNEISAPPIKSESKTTFRVNYLRPGGNPAVSVEERPQSPETFPVETYTPGNHYGMDNFYAVQSPPTSYSFFSYSPNDRPNIPPPSPQASQWDFFWNPFSSLDYYGYPTRAGVEQTTIEDEIRGLRQVREEEGIPDLEEDDTEQEEPTDRVHLRAQRPNINTNCCREEVLVEDVDDDDEDDDDEDDDDVESEETDHGTETEQKLKGLHTQGGASMKLSRAQNSRQVEVTNQERKVGNHEAKEEKPGFTVYVNRRPTSMAEVIKDLEDQFTAVCNAAREVSALLETSRAQYSSTSDLLAMKMLNPVALIRSASSRSASSRFLVNSSGTKDESCDSNCDFSEESMFSGSHQSTMDKLYAWEKKLYKEVKSGEKVRIAYEKKCKQLKNLDVNGADSSAVDKTRTALRDLHTQISVSIHTVEAISKRIETLRDEELQPQLFELVQGLSRMWKVMAECHQLQKRTLDEAKLLLAGTPTKQKNRRHSGMSLTEPQRLARSAANLETELRNWRACFESWITSQRSYVHALAGWLLRCVRCDPDTSRLAFSPRRSSVTLPIIGLCVQWSRSLDDITEVPVLDGLDFFSAGVGSLYAQQLREENRVGSKRFEHGSNMEVVEFGQVEEESMSIEKMAEVAIRVLCAGMSVAMSSLAEFAIGSAEGYDALVKQCENLKWPQQRSQS